ncbi:MAG: UDP-4-amino-4,6-dideoxy-N-acetyl-beta-L-altrosamine transaminase [Candidatus Zixiibacteriota bacterium]
MRDKNNSEARGTGEKKRAEYISSTDASPKFLPYGRQHVSDDDIDAVVKVLKSDWLTQGPDIDDFERTLAAIIGAERAVACSSGTAALHLAMMALGMGNDDEIVTSPITFLASANCARFVGAEVKFADIDARTGLMSPEALENILSADKNRKIRAVIPVHLGGQPVDLETIHELAKKHGAAVVDDACHALGARYSCQGKVTNVGTGSHTDMSVLSFHPVKHVAMGEGGAITTARADLEEKLKRFRSHGIRKNDFINRDMAYASDGSVNPWYYEMPELGYNYRLTDIQAALGMSQLRRLTGSLEKRNKIAADYRQLLHENFPEGTVKPLATRAGVYNAYHLFVVAIEFDRWGVSRAEVMNKLRAENIGTQVHYIPVPYQPYYAGRYGHKPGDFPGADSYYRRALSLPMYPELTETDCERVIVTLRRILTREL